jgi:hypothetical protein
VLTFRIGVPGIFTIDLGWCLYRVAHTFSAESVISLLLAIASIRLALLLYEFLRLPYRTA